jgi:hypothetical protein
MSAIIICLIYIIPNYTIPSQDSLLKNYNDDREESTLPKFRQKISCTI